MRIAAKVLTLKNSVPTNWIAADHQSIASAPPQPANRGRPLNNHWISEAVVKKIEPMKNVRPVNVALIAGNAAKTAPMANSEAPIAKKRASRRCSRSFVIATSVPQIGPPS